MIKIPTNLNSLFLSSISHSRVSQAKIPFNQHFLNFFETPSKSLPYKFYITPCKTHKEKTQKATKLSHDYTIFISPPHTRNPHNILPPLWPELNDFISWPEIPDTSTTSDHTATPGQSTSTK